MNSFEHFGMPDRALQKRPAFTLVELLVVIAIIGILIAMLLPAVQQVRESARRASCLNNAKQLGLSLHNYASAHMKFPKGADGATWWGTSWIGFALPYIEQNNTFDNLVLTESFHPAFSTANDTALEKWLPAFMNCPSSTMPADNSLNTQGGSTWPWLPPNRVRGVGSYVGIAGGYRAGLEVTSNEVVYVPSYLGWQSSNGALTANLNVTFEDITDGSSNVIMIGEQSDFVDNGTGTLLDLRSGAQYGSFIGCNISAIPKRGSAWQTPNTWPRAFNVTTIRYDFNTPLGPGMDIDVGPNNPLTSAHPGTCTVGFGDGSTHTLSESTGVDVMVRMAIRNDGAVN